MEQTQNTEGREKKRFFTARNIAWFAILFALVLVLQLWGSSISIGTTSFSLVLIPIVLGGILLGPIAGAVLGFTFGLITLIAGIVGTDLFTATLFQNSPFVTSLICLGKGTVAGLGAALLYRLIARRNRHVAVFVAAAAAPILNTGLFILGALTLSDILAANFVEAGTTVIYFLVIVCAGVNFLVEFAVNLICAPALYSVINAVERRYR